MRATGLASGLLGAKIPQCEKDGSFKKIQFWEGYQWCVDKNGIELLGTKVGPGGGDPDCSKGKVNLVPRACDSYGLRPRSWALGDSDETPHLFG